MFEAGGGEFLLEKVSLYLKLVFCLKNDIDFDFRCFDLSRVVLTILAFRLSSLLLSYTEALSEMAVAIVTGATLFQKAVDGKMEISVSAESLLRQLQPKSQVSFRCIVFVLIYHLPDLQITVVDLKVRSGAELTFATIFRILETIQSYRGEFYCFYSVF